VPEGIQNAMQPHPIHSDEEGAFWTGTSRSGDVPVSGRRDTSRQDTVSVRWSDLRPVLGARGALVTMFMATLLGHLTAQALHVTGLTGFGFAAGSTLAAGLARRRDLLIVATTPPVIFLTAITCAELIVRHLNHMPLSARPIADGVFLTLASTAPWLFCGYAGALVIAAVRGLVRCIGDLRSELRAPGNPLRPGGRRGLS